ncbi:MAG TPA: HEAT repeat domain-containing protein [Phycisphaeraceae bacterium]
MIQAFHPRVGQGLKLPRAWRPMLAALALACLGAGLGDPLVPVEPTVDGLIDQPIYQDPLLEEPQRETVFSPRLEELWLAALKRPEVDLRADAAMAFARAQEMGLPADQDVLTALTEVLKNEPHPLVAMAVARALIAFDASSAAPVMLDRLQATNDSGFALLVDPALARWDHQPARPLWLSRLEDAHAPQSVRISAIQSLATVQESKAIEPLLALATDAHQATPLRLEAAQALGRIAPSGLVEQAQQLSAGEAPDRVIAASMLGAHHDGQAVALLQQLGRDEDPVVASTALGVLNGIDPAQVAPLAADLLSHPDPNVRYELAAAVATRRSTEAAVTLARLLDDPSVSVRSLARQTLIDYDASPALRDTVREQLTAALTQQGWRGQEQAALAVGILDHEPAAPQIIALLDSPRPEVRLAAACALRRLAIPQTLPDAYARLQQLTQEALATNERSRSENEKAQEIAQQLKAIGQETTQLVMLIGQLGYTQAEPLLREYIPKHSGFAIDARSAAVWALGRFHEGQPEPELVEAFISRLSDVNPLDPEAQTVRRFAAVGLGRMKASDAMGALQTFYQSETYSADIGGACRWAIMQIAGEELPPLPPIVTRAQGWFLEPIEPSPSGF